MKRKFNKKIEAITFYSCQSTEIQQISTKQRTNIEFLLNVYELERKTKHVYFEND